MGQHHGCLWGRSESTVEIVPPVPGEEGDTELSVHPESSKPCPSLPCVPSSTEWDGCCAGSCLCSWAKTQRTGFVSMMGQLHQPS